MPLNIQTLYADLTQGLSFSPTKPGSVYTQTHRGKKYLYAREKHGSQRVERYLGPASDINAKGQAEDIRGAAGAARGRRTLVSMLKRAGVPAPSLPVGRVLESAANAGLFDRGLVLVGTAAYQIYSPIVGVNLSSAPMQTLDVDLAVVSLAVVTDPGRGSLSEVLQRADPSFSPQPTLERGALPRRFRAANGLEVDVITRVRKRADEERLVPIPGLQCSAQALRYLEYLTDDPIVAAVLYGSGVKVKVPQPARYAVHKLILAGVRKDMPAKQRKDLQQASELIEALRMVDPQSVDDALVEARAQGTKWKKNIDNSLGLIGYS